MSAERRLSFTLNGSPVQATAPPHWTLLQVLREGLLAYEVKYGCGEGVCGACAVLVDGEPVNACLLLGPHVEGAAVTTARGLLADPILQEELVARGAVQCGFCTPGVVVVGSHFLQTAGPDPSREEIRAALAANLCRCTGYQKIIDAIAAAAPRSAATQDR